VGFNIAVGHWKLEHSLILKTSFHFHSNLNGFQWQYMIIDLDDSRIFQASEWNRIGIGKKSPTGKLLNSKPYIEVVSVIWTNFGRFRVVVIFRTNFWKN
jgi:hypothetical protein